MDGYREIGFDVLQPALCLETKVDIHDSYPTCHGRYIGLYLNGSRSRGRLWAWDVLQRATLHAAAQTQVIGYTTVVTTTT